MFLAEASTRRPVAVSCLLIALVGLGLNAYRKMSLESLPQVDIPYVTIVTTWVGATPGDIETDVAKKIEDAVSGLDGLKHIESICLENVSQIVMEFDVNMDVDVVAVDVREKVDTILDDLPADCDRPVISKIDVNAQAVAILALMGDASVEEKYDYIDEMLGDRFAMLPGVAEVQTIGGNEREVHVDLDRDSLAAAGLTSLDVISALQANVSSLPSGRIRDNGMEISVKYDADYAAVEDIAGLEVVNRQGIRRYIRDLGQVSMRTAEIREAAFCNGEPCVIMKIVKKAEANTVQVVDHTRRRMNELQDALPGGMRLAWVWDGAHQVEASVRSTLTDILSGILLCAVILLFFLGNFRTTLVVCVTMPLTIIISFFFMGLIDYTLNASTLLALGLSVGILVSNSIVVLENVVKRFDDFPDRWEAARAGTNEVAVAVLASAGTNVVVMLPIGMMKVMVGKFFGPFALTTLIVNLVSIFISFTLTPILCAVFMKPADRTRRPGPLARFGTWWNGRLQALAAFYMRIMGWLACHRVAAGLCVLAAVGLLVHCFSFADRIGFTFFEQQDNGTIFVKLEFPIDYDLEKTTRRVIAIQDRLRRDLPDLVNCLASTGKVDSVGGGATQAVYLGQIQLMFPDKTERSWSIFDRIHEITAMLADETDCIPTVAIQSVMGGIATPVEIHIKGAELDTLDGLGRQVLQIVRESDGVGTADSTVRDGKPQIMVRPRRAVISDRGLNAGMFGTLLRGNMEGIKAATFKSGARSYDIRVKFDERPGRAQIEDYLIPGTENRPVRLETVADVTERRIPVDIHRMDKERVVKVTGTLTEGAKLQMVLDGIRKLVFDKNIMPPGYTFKMAGEAEMMGDAIAAFAEALLLAVFLTYLTLAAILESFSRPFLILVTLPLGLIGVLWILRLTGLGISIFVLLGIVMLIGIVVNAAVVIIDRMNQHQQAGLPGREAMVKALGDTFRTVLMLILASSLGMLPMALGKGLGSEMRSSIGWASFGGVIVAGILTMTILPLVYTIFTRKKA